MSDLYRLIPDPEDLLSMPVQRLAMAVLSVVKTRLETMDARRRLGGVNPMDVISNQFPELDYQPGYKVEDMRAWNIKAAIMEAFEWLRSHALLIPNVHDHGAYASGRLALSRQAEMMSTDEAWDDLVSDKNYPPTLLHPIIRSEAWPAFRSGIPDERGKAVKDAYLALEVAVRTASGLGASLTGDKLMSAAFGSTGRLRDPEGVPGEMEARAKLFAGAFGAFRNPPSHRYQDLGAREAYEQIMLASQLMHILDDLKRRLRIQ